MVVTLDDAADVAAAQRAVGRIDVHREFAIIPGFAATMTVGQAKAMAGRAGVFRVEPDFAVTVLNDANNRDFGTAGARQELGVDGAGTEVCVIDTGIDPRHEQLDSKSVAFYDAVNGRQSAYDDHGHGTHVAATAVGDAGSATAGDYAGVAPRAALSAAKVLGSSGSGTDAQVVAGIEFCAERTTVDVLSMSLGSGVSSDGNDAISQAADAAATTYGKTVVVAAGNSGDAPTTVGSPAAAREVIAVAAAAEWSSATSGAANASRGVHLAPWSSRGPTADGRTKPDVTAPGMSVTSAQSGTSSGYVTWSGTSMATPFVSGTAALMIDAGASPSAVKALVTGTAQDVGPSGQDNDWGYGLLDGYAAVAQAGGESGSTTFPAHRFADASVADDGVWRQAVEVTDTATPIAATVLIDGAYTCILPVGSSCWWYAWDAPDLDVRLVAPSGAVVAESTCPLNCDAGSIGRQETIAAMPTGTGTYTLEVYPYSGDPNNGKGGTFTGPFPRRRGEPAGRQHGTDRRRRERLHERGHAARRDAHRQRRGDVRTVVHDRLAADVGRPRRRRGPGVLRRRPLRGPRVGLLHARRERLRLGCVHLRRDRRRRCEHHGNRGHRRGVRERRRPHGRFHVVVHRSGLRVHRRER